MQNSEFEKNVQDSMDALRLSPAAAVWEQVEASLPPEKKPRRFLSFLLLAVLLAGFLFVWNGLYRQKQLKDTANRDGLAAVAGDNGKLAHSKQVQPATAVSVPKPASQEDIIKNTSVAAINKNRLLPVTRILLKNGCSGNDANLQDQKKVSSKDEATMPGNRNHFKNPGSVKVKITAPGATADTDPSMQMQTAATDILQNGEHKEKTDAAAPDPVSDDPAITDNGKLNKKDLQKKSWTTGVEAYAGTSYFSSGSYPAAVIFSSPAGISNPAAQNRTAISPFNYKPGFSWGAGLYAKKELSKRFSLYTALRYQYLSSSSSAGNKIDTAIRLGFGSSASITANSYYYTGTIKTYSNRLHLVELPAFIRLKPFRKLAFYTELGPSIGVMLHSNALVFNSTNAVYVSCKEAYGKMLFSMHAGAGFVAGQYSKWPFETGLRAGYTLNSAIKKDYGKLNALNVNLYVRVPFRKSKER